jgi:hypothetical protein
MKGEDFDESGLSWSIAKLRQRCQRLSEKPGSSQKEPAEAY